MRPHYLLQLAIQDQSGQERPTWNEVTILDLAMLCGVRCVIPGRLSGVVASDSPLSYYGSKT